MLKYIVLKMQNNTTNQNTSQEVQQIYIFIPLSSQSSTEYPCLLSTDHHTALASLQSAFGKNSVSQIKLVRNISMSAHAAPVTGPAEYWATNWLAILLWMGAGIGNKYQLCNGTHINSSILVQDPTHRERASMTASCLYSFYLELQHNQDINKSD